MFKLNKAFLSLISELFFLSRKGKKRSKAAAPDDITSTAKENADKENIGDSVKEMVDRENMDKENIAAENLFSDPGEDCEEGGRAEEQTAVGGPSHHSIHLYQ